MIRRASDAGPCRRRRVRPGRARTLGGTGGSTAARAAVPGTGASGGGGGRVGGTRRRRRGSAGGTGGGGTGGTGGGASGFIGAQYPRDVAIASDPRVLFASDFENGLAGWTHYTNDTDQITVLTDAALAHAGTQFLRAQVTRTQLAANANISANAQYEFATRVPGGLLAVPHPLRRPDRLAPPLGRRRCRNAELSVRRRRRSSGGAWWRRSGWPGIRSNS